jgi:hypothetical protein
VLTWEAESGWGSDESEANDDEDTSVWDSPSRSQAPLPQWTPNGEPSTALAPIEARPPAQLDDQPGWYARLKLREKHLAKLWAYNLTARDVMVWSPEHRDWVPLLALRQMRAAVLSVLQDTETDQSEKSAPRPLPNGAYGASLPAAGQGPEIGQAYASSSSIPPAVVPQVEPQIAAPPRQPSLRFLSVLAKIHPTLGPRCAQAISRAVASVYASPWVLRVLDKLPLANRVPLRPAERVFWALVVLVLGVLAGLRTNAPVSPTASVLTSAPVSLLASGPVLCAPSALAAPALRPIPERIFTLNDLATCAADASTRAPDGQKPGSVNAYERPRSVAVADALAARATQGTRPPGAALAKASTVKSKNPREAARQAEFDTDAARRALGGAVQKARVCAARGGAKGSMVVTFNQSGAVQSASLAGVAGTGVRKDCLVRVFAQARVPPFSGPPVTVRKSFDLQYSVQ